MNQKTKPARLQVPVDAQTKDFLQEYADASGSSIARVSSEILETTAPVMAELAKALREAKTEPVRAMKRANEMLEKQIFDANQEKLDLEPKSVGKKKTG